MEYPINPWSIPAHSRIPKPAFEVEVDESYRIPVVSLAGIDPELEKLGAVFYAALGFVYPPFNGKYVPASYMVKKSIEAGNHAHGEPFVEPTSGNMGVSLAYCAKRRELKAIAIVPDKLPEGKLTPLLIEGAEVVKESQALAALGLAKSPGSVELGKRYAEHVGGVNLNQYGNSWNAEAWHTLVAPKLYAGFEGNIAMFVAAVGTRGTLTGLGGYFRKQNPNIKIAGTMPYNYQEIGGTRSKKRQEEVTNSTKSIEPFIEEPIDAGTAKLYSNRLNIFGVPGGESAGAAFASAAHLFANMDVAEREKICELGGGSFNILMPFTDSLYPYA